ncbi:hypothetical protein A2311_04225 [candidate division WOR-1 bacterium RIFOXYB2_FULL_48_7]|uniref:Uncharacterized protein n=1 Tax=candidate division WOR-1 bacterium RIFOXYB2_FULL_48_7 TaxID=1802583 RepID=A0A1F4TW46_UNCSA|nr:MAG: hypothetical protein A2311_04225 [candidate division WOR-1 bacterium RIFOXYB2_FULL_48_7]
MPTQATTNCFCTRFLVNQGLAAKAGKDMRKAGQAREAISFLTVCRTLAPNDIKTVTEIGHCHLVLGEFEAARKHFALSLEIDQTNIVALNSMGKSFAEEKKYITARQWYARSLATSPKDVSAEELVKLRANTYLAIGNSYLQERNNHLARDNYLIANGLSPREPEIMVSVAETYFYDKALFEAEGWAGEVLAIDPLFPKALEVMGLVRLSQKRPAEAAEYFGKIVTNYPRKGRPYELLATAQIFMGRLDEALATLATELAAHPNRSDGRILQAKIHYLQGQPKECLDALLEALKQKISRQALMLLHILSVDAFWGFVEIFPREFTRKESALIDDVADQMRRKDYNLDRFLCRSPENDFEPTSLARLNQFD